MKRLVCIIDKYGFFRLTLVPLGVTIIIFAWLQSILGMGIIGSIVLTFGLLNKCLLLGNCEIPEGKRK